MTDAEALALGRMMGDNLRRSADAAWHSVREPGCQCEFVGVIERNAGTFKIGCGFDRSSCPLHSEGGP